MGGNLFRPFYFESLQRLSDVPLYDAAVHPTRLTPAEDWLLASGGSQPVQPSKGLR